MRRFGVALLACLGIALLIPARAAALPSGTHVQLFMGGLNSPVDMAYVAGTHKMFFTEKDTGAIRVIQNGNLLPTPCVDLDVVSDGERGALGLVLDPAYRQNHFLYVYFTKRSPLENRVTRFTVVNNRCTAARPIITGIPTISGYHNGGQLLFMGGKLFVTVGEGHNAANAQSLRTRLGKILRYNPSGTVPSDNPFLNGGHRSPIWSYGHRNGFGLVHKPGTQLLYESENGPNCDDELNHIMRGRNYGWGADYVCGTNGVGPNPVAPMKRWTPTIAPTDPWWYGGTIVALRGSIYLGDFNTGTLRRITLNAAGTAIRSIVVTYQASGGIIDVSSGPGGWLYFATQTGIYRIIY
jgi:glucose/arabinose dehydrogenase